MNKTNLKILTFIGLLVLSVWFLMNKTQNPSSTVPANNEVVFDESEIPVEENVLNDMLALNYPTAGEVVTSPLIVTGSARGGWFFEGSFPVVLTDWDGLIIAEGVAQAEGEWMTDEFVPFTAELTYTIPAYGDTGSLILQKANPSGLSENDDAVEITINFR